ncbi:putative N6-adenine-specific DNA methylase [Acidaminobacter hydrogenoformans DSM 2784]|uniref:Putative N6-adenine-specific DNA methylase n=1 Tax=Acidaminobacter hydrogenoformans DSM 2784 TaxID=1120920 RepID=A0A1G5RS15_9FIRM|nr:putative N6-adenine-specific DNA methylase [Acidaminobacter hydrogenoformans DSM 2784]
MMIKKFRLQATAAFGIESVVADEIKALGFDQVLVENGRVEYDSDLAGIVRSNLWLRSADRVFIKLAEFKADTFEALFQGVRQIDWAAYIPQDGTFPVNAKSVKSTLFSLSDIQSISKKAVVEKLKETYKTEWFNETGPRYSILVSILKDNVIVLLDTSGEGLHKRGYREKGNEAPLKETLAAALVRISRWRPFIPLIDPLCGSGTLLIEAALIGLNQAPGLNRKFDSEHWHWMPASVWDFERNTARNMIRKDTNFMLEGYDIDPRSIRIARENAEKAGVSQCIHFQTRDVAELSSKDKYGYILTNPPYGERLSDLRQVEKLYSIMGDRFVKLDTWSWYVITAHEGFEAAFGKKATKNRKLYNGRIKCYFYQYFGPKPPKRVVEESENI